MAEAVGLALGTIALASLFTTSLELIDYFELSRSYKYDYERACLKLSLLKSRLDAWGRALEVCDNVGLDKELREHWPREEMVIHRSLLGIADIFGNAGLLKDKYSLRPRKSRSITTSFAREAQGPPPDHKPRRHFINRHSHPSFLRRSTTWAIRDKQKFDSLISDLEFFISNLEAISLRLHTTTAIASTMNNSIGFLQPNDSTENANETTATSSGRGANQSRRRTGTRQAQAPVIRQENPQQNPSEIPASTAGDEPTLRSRAESGYHFLIENTHDRTGVFLGASGGARLEPAAHGQVVDFRVENMRDDSRIMSGAMSDANFDNFFNTTARELRA